MIAKKQCSDIYFGSVLHIYKDEISVGADKHVLMCPFVSFRLYYDEWIKKMSCSTIVSS